MSLVLLLFVPVRYDEGGVHVVASKVHGIGYLVLVEAEQPRPMMLHWAVNDWELPSPDCMPPGTNKVRGGGGRTRIRGARREGRQGGGGGGGGRRGAASKAGKGGTGRTKQGGGVKEGGGYRGKIHGSTALDTGGWAGHKTWGKWG